jgi:hypothetical protein
MPASPGQLVVPPLLDDELEDELLVDDEPEDEPPLDDEPDDEPPLEPDDDPEPEPLDELPDPPALVPDDELVPLVELPEFEVAPLVVPSRIEPSDSREARSERAPQAKSPSTADMARPPTIRKAPLTMSRGQILGTEPCGRNPTSASPPSPARSRGGCGPYATTPWPRRGAEPSADRR